MTKKESSKTHNLIVSNQITIPRSLHRCISENKHSKAQTLSSITASPKSRRQVHRSNHGNIKNYRPEKLIALLKAFCPSISFLILSSSLLRSLPMSVGSEAILLASSSERQLTLTGQKIFSRSRTIWRSITWMVTLATKLFCNT